MGKEKTGTNEWSESRVNIQLGCEHGCRYCYAKYDAVKRHHWCTAEEWPDPVIVRWRVHRSFMKRLGVVMYPSTHYITERNLSESVRVLRSLLESRNQVLVVSKPSYDCIAALCHELKIWNKQMMFRFTMGSMDPDVLAFWEPGAPCFDERLLCLQFAYENGFRTSVSCEPFLDADLFAVVNLYEKVLPFVTDKIWVGIIKHFNQRVDLTGTSLADRQRFVFPLKEAQTAVGIWALYNQLRHQRLIEWKDSISSVIVKGPMENIMPGEKPIDLCTAWGGVGVGDSEGPELEFPKGVFHAEDEGTKI